MTTKTYASLNDYKAEYGSGNLGNDEIMRNIKRAQREIEDLCFGRIQAAGFDNLSDFQKSRIKAAVIVQAKYLSDYKDAIDAPISSFTVGSVSVSAGSGGSNGGTIPKVSQRAIDLVEGSGLRWRKL